MTIVARKRYVQNGPSNVQNGLPKRTIHRPRMPSILSQVTSLHNHQLWTGLESSHSGLQLLHPVPPSFVVARHDDVFLADRQRPYRNRRRTAGGGSPVVGAIADATRRRPKVPVYLLALAVETVNVQMKDGTAPQGIATMIILLGVGIAVGGVSGAAVAGSGCKAGRTSHSFPVGGIFWRPLPTTIQGLSPVFVAVLERRRRRRTAIATIVFICGEVVV